MPIPQHESEPRGVTALRIASSFLPMNQAILDLSTGNLPTACASFVGMGVSALLAYVEGVHRKDEKEPDYSRLGMGRMLNIAEHAVKAPGVVQGVWRELLVQATDPANTEFEVRQSDIELIESLNPSDAVLILGFSLYANNKLKWIEDWRSSDATQRLAIRAGRHQTTEWLREALESHVPLRFIRDYAGQTLASKITVSNQSLLAALNERAQDRVATAALFDGVKTVTSWMAKVKKSFAEQRVVIDAGWQLDLEQQPDDALVMYSLRPAAERLRLLLGLDVPATEEPETNADHIIRVGGLR